MSDAAPPMHADSWRRRETVYERFEESWEGQMNPAIGDFLPPPNAPDRAIILHELIKIDLEHRWGRGLPIHVEDYARQFPELAETGIVPVALILEEIQVRRQRGHSPDMRELQTRFPGQWDDLRPRLDGLAAHQDSAATAPTEIYRETPPSGRPREPETNPVALPKRLGRYELGEQVGRGGFAAVFRSWDPELHREVAIKVPRADLLEDPEIRTRLMREARSAARLRHPAIVPLHEVGQDGSNMWLVYEFIPGPTLAQELLRTRPAPQQAAQWVATLAEALDYAHQAGIVHRDVKPANIMMGGEGQPVLTDFGLALHDEATTTLTHQGDILGTPAYMSPEQAGGRGHEVDARTDVYSLGVLLYEIISGQLPFQAKGFGLLHQVIHDEPTPPRTYRASIPVDLETICLKAMAKEPNQRYATAGALAVDLHRYLNHQPILARRIGPFGKLIRWGRRNPALATTLAVAILTVTLVGTYSYWRVVQEKNRFQQQRDRAQELAANLALDRGLGLCEQGEVGPGLLWLVRSLELTPPHAAAQQRAIRYNLAAWGERMAYPHLILPHLSNSVAFDADGALYTAGEDGFLRRWNLQSGQEILPALPNKPRLLAVALSPDGKNLVTGGDHGMGVFWDLGPNPTKKWTVQLSGDLFAAAYHPFKPMVILVSHQEAVLVNTETGKKISPPLLHKALVGSCAFSPDGKTAVTGGQDAASLWDVATGKAVGVLPHSRNVPAVAFSPDGTRIVTGCGDNKARIWDRETAKPLHILEHRGIVFGVAFSPSGHFFLTASNDRTARLWDASTGTPLSPPLQHAKPLTSVAVARDGRTFATACTDGLVRVWNVPAQMTQGKSLAHDAPVWSAVYSPDGTKLLTGCGLHGSKAGAGQLWDVARRAKLGPPLPHKDVVMVVAVSPDNELLLTGGWDFFCRGWDARTGQENGAPIEQTHGLSALAFAPSGKEFVTGNQRDKELTFWDTATRRPTGMALAELHQMPVRTVVFSRDGKVLLTGSYDRTARLWDAATGQPIGPVMEHEGQVGAAALNPDATLALTGTDDNWGQVWNLVEGNVAAVRLPHKGTVRAVAFSPDGKFALTGSWDKTVRLWEPLTGKSVGPPMIHDAEVETVAFHPDGQSFLTGGWDKQVRFWRIPRPVEEPLHRLRLWIEVLSGLELDATETTHLLDSESWRQRRQQLDALGGQPF